MAHYGVGPVCFESISAVTATPSVDIGTVREHAGEKYVYFYNAGATAGVGLGLVRPTSATGAYTMAVSSASGDFCHGFVKHASVASGSYAWALTKGMLTFAVASSASDQAAGAKALGANGLIATNTAGYFLVGDAQSSVVSGNSGTLCVSLR
jgi:hypothetical protein